MKITKYENEKTSKNIHTIHTIEHNMYLGKPIREKTQLQGEAYALLSFLQLWKASTKKEALIVGFPLTLWLE
jgi:hypothetical protein